MAPPEPIWAAAPRLAPAMPWPDYAYLPGRTPHPGGGPPLQGEDPLRAGIDLYHAGYLWEAHEVWEDIWRAAGRDSPAGQCCQGLIQHAAALLQARLGHWRGAGSLSRRAFARLQAQQDAPAAAFEIDLPPLTQAMAAHYAPLWAGENRLEGPAPRLMIRARNGAEMNTDPERSRR